MNHDVTTRKYMSKSSLIDCRHDEVMITAHIELYSMWDDQSTLLEVECRAIRIISLSMWNALTWSVGGDITRGVNGYQASYYKSFMGIKTVNLVFADASAMGECKRRELFYTLGYEIAHILYQGWINGNYVICERHYCIRLSRHEASWCYGIIFD